MNSVTTSHLLVNAAEKFEGERISFKDFIHAGGERGILLAMVLCILPNTLPVPLPPGLSTVFAVPVMLMALQLFMGRRSLWLPEWIMRKTLPVRIGKQIFVKGALWFSRLERHVRPRRFPMPFLMAERISALIIIGLSALIALPILWGNFLPAVAVVLICVSLMERDGALMVIGWVFSALAVCWVIFMAYALVQGVSFGLERFGFGE